MAYTPTVWVTGDKVTSAKLNKIENGIADKVDKVSGKTLSTNDYTNADKKKVDDISISSPTNGQALVYNSSTQKWENKTISSGGSGQDGYSPTITVTNITGGHRVSITDVTGTKEFDVMDGTDGTNGINGTNGSDGFSPTVTVTNITNGHRVSITDVTGTKIFDVMNGSGSGDGGSSINVDDTLTISGDAADAKATGDAISTLNEDLNSMTTATSSDVGKALKAKTVINGKVTEWEFGEAGGGSPFDLPTATNLITILRNCVFAKDVSIAIDNLAEALGVNGGDGGDDSMTFQYGQSIPKGNTSRTLELTGMSISLTEIRLVVALHSDFAQGGFCWVQVPNRGTPYVGVDGNGDFYYSNANAYPGSFSATPSNLSDFVDTIKEVRIIWLNPSGWESQKYLSGFKFFFNGYNPSCGYTLYRCSGFNGSTEVFRLESTGTNGELYDVLTGTTYTFNNTTGMEIVGVSE